MKCYEGYEALDQIHNINFELLCEVDRVCTKHGIKYYVAYGTLIGAVRHQDFIPWDDDVDIWLASQEDYEKLLSVGHEFAEPYFLRIPKPTDNYFWDFTPQLLRTDTLVSFDADENAYYEHCNAARVALDFFVLIPSIPKKVKQHRLKLRLLYGLAMSRRYTIDYQGYSLAMKIAAVVLSNVGKLFPSEALFNAYQKETFRFFNSKKATALVVASLANAGWNFSCFDPAWFSDEFSVSIRGREFPAPVGYHFLLETCYGSYMTLPPEEQRIPKHIKETKIIKFNKEENESL